LLRQFYQGDKYTYTRAKVDYKRKLKICNTDHSKSDTPVQIKGVFDYPIQLRIQSKSGFRFAWQIEWL